MKKTQTIEKPPIFVFKGQKVSAYYHEEISIYRGNPLIEALPEILTEEQVIEQLQFYPHFNSQELLLPKELRLHLLQNVLQFFTPLPVHIDLEQRFSRLIRAGYIARNPLNLGFWKDLNQRVDSLSQNRCLNQRLRSTATGFTILGISGVGKSTAVEQILSLYPQVIYHSRYGNRRSTNTQLVWLKLECPSDASVKGLCLNFFQSVDDILETSYYLSYGGKGRRTLNELMPDVARVASLVHLGVLVIDEIQVLSKLRSGGHEKMLDFFVQLINMIGLPVVLVGTYKAWSVLGSEFRQIRRGTGQGDLVWERMKEDEDWLLFIESLWQYQYVQFPCQLTDELSHALYYESQGITDLAVKLFMLAQVRAITTGKEKLTKGIIQSVALDYLRTAREVLNALKSGSLERLKNCEDVRPITIEPFLEQELGHLFVANSINPQTATAKNSVNKSRVEPSMSLSPEPEPELEQAFGSNSSPVQATKKAKKRPTATSPAELPEIVSNGASSGMSAYETLKQAGYIGGSTEFISGEEGFI
ncbi:ATP-binding protein [Coleofasciculus sp. G2-EDA-02]|uniref:ATP-binding protein n=1 Tax=Coleofasciculus sp. G2-EDA-02 TaxID=3069529 RepID=UPI0032FD886F